MNLLHQQNMKYRLVIFDFDGTIADTSKGIMDSHIYTLKIMGKGVPSENDLLNVIGGNLLDTYINVFGLDEDVAREAVKIYRQRYSNVGIHMATLYPEFANLLMELKKKECLIGLATLKAEIFARKMLEELGVINYFDQICGMDCDDRLDKAALIKKCCVLSHCDKQKVIMVGDSVNDYIGAQKVGVDFLGVKYGFGFKTDFTYQFNTINQPMDLLNFLC